MVTGSISISLLGSYIGWSQFTLQPFLLISCASYHPTCKPAASDELPWCGEKDATERWSMVLLFAVLFTHKHLLVSRSEWLPWYSYSFVYFQVFWLHGSRGWPEWVHGDAEWLLSTSRWGGWGRCKIAHEWRVTERTWLCLYLVVCQALLSAVCCVPPLW